MSRQFGLRTGPDPDRRAVGGGVSRGARAFERRTGLPQTHDTTPFEQPELRGVPDDCARFVFDPTDDRAKPTDYRVTAPGEVCESLLAVTRRSA